MRPPQVPGRAPARWGDVAIATGSLVVLEIENATVGLHRGWVAIGALLVGLITLEAVWRRRTPRAFVTVVLVLSTALVAVWSANGVAAQVTVTPLYVLVFVPYVGARHCSLRPAVATLVTVLAWGLGLDAWAGPTPAASYLSTSVVVAAAWAVGRWLRARKLLNTELAHNTERIAAEGDSRIRLSVADERTRMARELHALIAGSVSAMVIQAEAAELLLEADAAAADAAMAAVEQVGRNALADMRSLLGVLRHAEEPPSLAPQPGVGQIYALVEAERSNGRRIELSVEGNPGPLPASVDLAIYRILEESLRGGPDGNRVQLRFTERAVELEIRAAGGSGSTQWPTLAMNERAAICGGTVQCRALQEECQLSVSLPRQFDEVLA
jgi:signal transduction histidine kinase